MDGKLRLPRLCFVGLKCYDLLVGREPPRYIGGIETQMTLLAKALAERGFPVAFITYDHGQPDAIRHDGIGIYKAYDRAAGLPGLRFVAPRWTGLCAAMARADADMYYQMGAGSETGQVALWCRMHRRKFVFATASDSDCVRALPLLRSLREKLLYRMGLLAADLVVSQTNAQQLLLREGFAVASQVIPGCSPEPRLGLTRWRDPIDGRRPHVLWVGRFSPQKRLEWLLDIAERLPRVQFDVVGGANERSEYADQLVARASHLDNVFLHGRIRHAELARYYRSCSLLVCTSRYEGFPNTFLEAWSQGVPIVTTFDPDELVSLRGLGRVASTVEGAARAIDELLSSSEQWSAASFSAKEYYAQNHTLERCMPKFESVFLKVFRGPGGRLGGG